MIELVVRTFLFWGWCRVLSAFVGGFGLLDVEFFLVFGHGD